MTISNERLAEIKEWCSVWTILGETKATCSDIVSGCSELEDMATNLQTMREKVQRLEEAVEQVKAWAQRDVSGHADHLTDVAPMFANQRIAREVVWFCDAALSD